jgi:hypothetical protein
MKLFSFEDWELTQDTLRDVLYYNPETGEFYWLVKPSSRTHIGQRAGCLGLKGYRYIKLDGKSYQEHRLLWLYVYGEWPKGDLDFVDRDPTNIRIENLREATKSQNGGNAVGRREGKLKGAFWHKRSERWCSMLNNKWLGFFDTEEEAHAAYCEAAKKYFGEFFCSGNSGISRNVSRRISMQRTRQVRVCFARCISAAFPS